MAGMASVKLLICYHKKYPLFEDSVMTPIHVGRVLSDENKNKDHNWLMNNMIGDDTGINISNKNGYYNEMTAIYWAWKNYDKLGNPDYIGLMHYRRHFVLNPGELDVYNIRDFNQDTYLEEINYSEEKIKKLVEKYDFLPHIGKVNNVYRHFTENQRKSDLDLVNDIVAKMYPEYVEYMPYYFNNDYSNFCNMFIFKKDLFFKYCEWIFSILEEFEKRIDISEKRFFVSERLTGLFIFKLMNDKNLKYKELPISFIDEPSKIHVAVSAAKDKVTKSALSLHSIMKNADDYNQFIFHLFADSKQLENVKKDFLIFEEKYNNCELEFNEYDGDDEYLLPQIPILLQSVKKCVYLSGNTIALKDIGEFFRICSTDDYYMVGVPYDRYDPRDNPKKIQVNLVVLNCGRMRKYYDHNDFNPQGYSDVDSFINDVFKNEVSYLPWYLFTSEKLTIGNTSLFFSNYQRRDLQEMTLWRPFLVYDHSNPVENNMGILSVFWWDMFVDVPLPFQKLDYNPIVLNRLQSVYENKIKTYLKDGKKSAPILKKNDNNEPLNNVGFVFSDQMKQIVRKRGCDSSNITIDKKYIVPDESLRNKFANKEVNEDWRNYGFMGKLRFYYEHNGLKQTFKYAVYKVKGGNVK